MNKDTDLKIYLVSANSGQDFSFYALAKDKATLSTFLKSLYPKIDYTITLTTAYHSIVYFEDTNTYEIVYYAPHLRHDRHYSPRFVLTRPDLLDCLEEYYGGRANA